ncbi:hypothetical protein BDQ12DRAFT_674839 [Crucibulum laeve]|uniref:Peroxisomal biogenesis factor 11 n=1 Tax=Crucibulum laeve TaxID=68775 RepID=A0A5C3MD31_9AGAR|nr:hypothetical protein BDQ12DRAFT_674839 [Crucibulum laeve]
MSSISFPSEHVSGRPSDSHDGQFYSSSFDASSSFHMNPLSSHPPRTPRTSVISNSSSQIYGASIYEEKVDITNDASKEDLELDEDEERVKEAEKRIRKEDVWREMFLTSYGRDKAFKLIQYSIRVFLVFHTNATTSRLLRRQMRPPWELELVKRLTSAASGLSFTRKMLLLFNWLQPLTAIMAQQTVPFSAEQSTESSKKTQRPFLHTVLYAPPPVLLELVNALADDVATFSKLGLLGKKVGERAGRFSDWCWFFATLVGLVENGVERQVMSSLQAEVEGRLYTESMSGATAKSKPSASKIDEKELSRLQKQDYWLQISRAKLVMDLIFVSYELFNIRRARDSVKAFTGLTAAVLCSAKFYDRQKNALLKSIISS